MIKFFAKTAIEIHNKFVKNSNNFAIYIDENVINQNFEISTITMFTLYLEIIFRINRNNKTYLKLDLNYTI